MTGATHTPLELIEKLIAFPTVSRDSNMALINFAKAYLEGWGADCQIFKNPEGNKANLLASIGPKDRPGIILSGHTDVVPVDGQPWSNPAFEPWTHDDKLFGRGACDMKGFIGIALSRVPEMVRRGLKERIVFALSYDEEIGCAGVLSMVEDIARWVPRPRCCIVGEPTDMKVVTAHKGMRSYRTVVHGRAGHSSAPHLGANAIVAAAKLVTFLAEMAEEAKVPEVCDQRFFPPYTTFNVGEIRGGTAMNIIPSEAELIWEYRLLPSFDGDAAYEKFRAYAEGPVLAALRETAPDAEIEIFELSNVPPLLAEEDSDAETFVKHLAQRNETESAAYTTEAGQFQTRADIPTIVCGPGSIDQAHKADEFVLLSQLEACERFFDRLTDAVCVA